MKGQRWKHIIVEEEKRRRGGEGGRGLCVKWWGRWMVFIGREGWKTINGSQKTCKNTFYKADHRPKRFLCGADHRPKLLVQSGIYNPDYTWIPDYIFRKNTIMAWTKGKLGTLCMVSVGSDFRIRIASALDSFVCPHCTNNFCGPQRPDTCINRGPCFHHK